MARGQLLQARAPASRGAIALGAAVAVLLSGLLPAQAGSAPDLRWLVGHWCSEPDADVGEELWLPERGGLMLGLGRSLSSRGITFEFLRIEIAAGGAEYVAQPNGAPPTRFRLAAQSANAATFENPGHDDPKRIRYLREGDRLFATADAGAQDPNPTEYRWRLCDGGE